MYIFGADVPLVEIVLFLFLVDVVILVLLFFHLLKVKKIEGDNHRLSKILLSLENKELEQLKKIADIRGINQRKVVTVSKKKPDQTWNKIVNFVIEKDTGHKVKGKSVIKKKQSKAKK